MELIKVMHVGYAMSVLTFPACYELFALIFLTCLSNSHSLFSTPPDTLNSMIAADSVQGSSSADHWFPIATWCYLANFVDFVEFKRINLRVSVAKFPV